MEDGKNTPFILSFESKCKCYNSLNGMHYKKKKQLRYSIMYTAS